MDNRINLVTIAVLFFMLLFAGGFIWAMRGWRQAETRLVSVLLILEDGQQQFSYQTLPPLRVMNYRDPGVEGVSDYIFQFCADPSLWEHQAPHPPYECVSYRLSGRSAPFMWGAPVHPEYGRGKLDLRLVLR